MRLPTMRVPGIRSPLRTLGPGSVSSLLKIALDVAYAVLLLVTGLLVVALVLAAFIPIQNFENVTIIIGSGPDARAVPVQRSLLVFGVGSFAVYFAGFTLILRSLRLVFRTLTRGDPFEPANVRRLRQVGLILGVVTGGMWIWQALVARFGGGGMESPNPFDLLTPLFAVLIVFVLAEVFREGARLRRESELTI